MGMIAMNSLLSAPADGHTLLTDTPASAIDPKLHKEQARYNPRVDVAPIAQFMRLPFVLAPHPNVRACTTKELAALLRQLNEAVCEVMRSSQTREYPQNCGARSSDMGLKEFRSFFRAEIDKWTKVVRKVQIKY